MKDTKLYSAHDIEKLRQKISTYRDTLTTLKTGNSIDNYLSMKSEFNRFKAEISKLEGVIDIMDEKQSTKIEKYEQQAENLSLQIGSLNQTVGELNQDISIIMKKLTESDSIEETLNTTTEKEDSEVNLTIEEMAQLKQQITSSPIQKSNLPPSFKQLRNFINTAKDIQEVQTTPTSIENTAIHKKYQENQKHVNKQHFPSNSSIPHQTYNSLHRNTNIQPTVSTNHTRKTRSVPIKINQSPLKPVIPTNSNPEQDVAEIAPLNTSHLTAHSEEEIAIIEEVEATEMPIETKQQEDNRKETLSFLKFFRKKN